MQTDALVLPAPSNKRAAKPATSVVRTSEPDSPKFGFAAGRHLVVDHQGVAWPTGNVGDILDIDFDCRKYDGEGDYLIEMNENADGVITSPGFPTRWTCVRTFGFAGQFELSIREPALIGGWEWKPFTAAMKARTTFLGKLHDVYRSSRGNRQQGIKFVGKLCAIGEHGDGAEYAEFQHQDGRKLVLNGLTDTETRKLAPMMSGPAKLEISA
jgi:hypothetical protein